MANPVWKWKTAKKTLPPSHPLSSTCPRCIQIKEAMIKNQKKKGESTIVALRDKYKAGERVTETEACNILYETYERMCGEKCNHCKAKGLESWVKLGERHYFQGTRDKKGKPFTGLEIYVDRYVLHPTQCDCDAPECKSEALKRAGYKAPHPCSEKKCHMIWYARVAPKPGEKKQSRMAPDLLFLFWKEARVTRIVIHDWVSKVKNLTRTCAKCTRKEPSIEPTHCPACGELLEEAEDPSKHQLKTQAYATALYHVYHVMADGLTEYGTEKRRHQPLPPPPIPPPKK